MQRLQLPAERPILQRGEEFVEVGCLGQTLNPQRLDLADARSKFLLKSKRRNADRKTAVQALPGQIRQA